MRFQNVELFLFFPSFLSPTPFNTHFRFSLDAISGFLKTILANENMESLGEDNPPNLNFSRTLNNISALTDLKSLY